MVDMPLNQTKPNVVVYRKGVAMNEKQQMKKMRR